MTLCTLAPLSGPAQSLTHVEGYRTNLASPEPGKLYTYGEFMPKHSVTYTGEIYRLLPAFALTVAAGLASAPALAQPLQPPRLRIKVVDAQGNSVTHLQERYTGSRAQLMLERTYLPGDHIVIEGPAEMAVQLDQTMPTCRIFHSTPGPFVFAVPFGSKEPESGSVFAPAAFRGPSHRITAHALQAHERAAYRNLALNPCDQPELPAVGNATEPVVFPHATSNSVYSRWPAFAERNAIDGVIENGRHGPWPYQSWGPDQRNDLWWQLDFGREVEIDKVRLAVRADFPHDSYWQSAVIEFSDGHQETIHPEPARGLQEFRFARRQVRWLRLTHLIPAGAGWCALIEFEAWGTPVRQAQQ